MSDKSGQTFELPKPSNLLGQVFATLQNYDNPNHEKVMEIPLTEIDPFPNHPFKVKEDEAMHTMAESIKSFGIQTPAIVQQKKDGRYQLISGHRRKKACEIAGIEKLPCIIREFNKEEAVIAMIDANLQRENILPSEKAKSYKMQLDAMKRTAGRPSKENVSPVGTNLRSDEELAQATVLLMLSLLMLLLSACVDEKMETNPQQIDETVVAGLLYVEEVEHISTDDNKPREQG